MTVDEYVQLIEDRDGEFAKSEAIERMRVNVGLIEQNIELKRKIESASRVIQVELLRRQAEETKDAAEEEDETKLHIINAYARAMNDATKIVAQVLHR
jgi:ABC-type histidine transport system ATPase subunit